MTTNPQTDRPEVDDPRVLALAKARQQRAHQNPFNAGFCPPWDGLDAQEQRLSLLDARNYLRAAIDAGLVASVPSVPTTQAADRAALAEDLRYLLNHREPRHAHEKPGVWDTSGKPCDHCARLAVARQNLAAYDAVVPAAVEEQPDTNTPRRGDPFEQWLKAHRDAAQDNPESWNVLDGILDHYRLHADTGTPLGEHACEGRTVGDCECLETPAAVAQPGKEA